MPQKHAEEEYYPNQSIRLDAEFRDNSANLSDPTTITFRVLPPKGGTLVTKVHGTDAEVIKDGTGQYHMNYTPTDWGVLVYSTQGAGAVIAFEERRIEILEPFAD